MSELVTTLREVARARLRDQHDIMRALLRDVDDDMLYWEPGEEMNSIAWLIEHSLIFETRLLRAALADPADPLPGGRFGKRRQQLSEALEQVESWTEHALDQLTAEHLMTVLHPQWYRRERHVPGAWWLLQALEHNREHLAQALMTKQLFEQRPGCLAGCT